MLFHQCLSGVGTAVKLQIELAEELGQQGLIQDLDMVKKVLPFGKAEARHSFQITLAQAILEVLAGGTTPSVSDPIEVQKGVAELTLRVSGLALQEGGGIV